MNGGKNMEYNSKTTVASIIDDFEYVRKRKKLNNIATFIGCLIAMGFPIYCIDILKTITIGQLFWFILLTWFISCGISTIVLAFGYRFYLKEK